MKKTFFFAALIACGTLGVLCQEVISTSTLEGARFEVIQSPLDKATTFRLDKFTGNIDRLGTCPKDDGFGSNKCWKEMIVFDLPKTVAAKPRYQIIINGPLKLTMLMQIDTGRSWQFGVDPQERWYPFIDCTDRMNSNCLWRP